MKHLRNNTLSWILFFGAVSSCFLGTARLLATALDDYVAQADTSYNYIQQGTGIFDWSTLTTAYTFRLTSQKWRNPTEVDNCTWQHWLTIVVPSSLLGKTKDTAFLFIDGGNYNDPAPEIDPNLRLIAAANQSVTARLTAVPNQPLLFSDETQSRSEDEIIAYSWHKFFTSGDSYWPVQLPMVKSVVKGMDALQDFMHTEYSAKKDVATFVLSGGSKRGWTAWLTAAVDSRVRAIIPIVSDLLNMKRSFAHHWAVYGFWAEALSPYEEMGIFDWLDTPQANALMEIVDPYEYRKRLDMPKFIINAAGDDFFVSDSIQFYFNALPGENYLRHVPNANHYLTGAMDDVLESLAAYYNSLLTGKPRPRFSWLMRNDGAIEVHTKDTPKVVKLWQASNTQTRDFRLTTTGAAWTSSPLQVQGDGVYVATVPLPESGWTAFFVELIYDGIFMGTDYYDYHFTTEMRVLPEICPYEADFTHDRITDLGDLAVLSTYWLTGNNYRDIAPRRGGDGIINLQDFAVFAGHWLDTWPAGS